MNDYMILKEMDLTNHHIFSHVNEEYFYKGLERAKVEGLYVDHNGRIDLHKLIQLLWGTFADGKYIIIPDHSDRAKVVDFIKHMDAVAIDAVAEMIIEAKPKRKSRAKPKVEIDPTLVDASVNVAN